MSVRSYIRRWPGDVMAAAVAVSVILALSVAVYGRSPGDATHVMVQAEGRRHIYSLDEDVSVTFEGPIGETIMRIENGEVWVAEDPGPLQICVEKGRISNPDEWLACLPNEVFIRIAGEGQADGLDGHAF
ncbi:MAG: NusG domain II-containing protein [Spirochaetaceae bacterium]